MPKLEQAILNSILHYLTISKIWHRRMNSGVHQSEYKGKRSFVRYGSVGMADVLASVKVVIEGRWHTEWLWIEVKAPKGKQSPAQIEFMDEVRHEGHYYAVVRSIEDVEAVLKEITG